MDPREGASYRYMEAYYRTLYEPSFGQASYASEPSCAARGDAIAYTGSILDGLSGSGRRVVEIVDPATGHWRRVAHGNGDAFAPKWSPCGGKLALLSDRREAGVYQACLVDAGARDHVTDLPAVEGIVEYLDWSPDGKRLLLGVAGMGAELSGMQGATTTRRAMADLPSWVPTVQSGFAPEEWRSLWVYELETHILRRLTRPGRNPWEACWAGNSQVLAVISGNPDEAAWYTATLELIELLDGNETRLLKPRDQLGVPAAAPDGKHVAVISAVCSDRAIVAGDLWVGAPGTGLRQVSSVDVDVTHIAWRDNRRLVAIGVRRFETVVLEHDVVDGHTREVWASDEHHGGFWYPAIAALATDEFAFVTEGYLHVPRLLVVGPDGERAVRTFGHALVSEQIAAGLYGHRVENVAWEAADGLEVQGTLILPRGTGPCPLIVEVHGGPIWMQRSRWMSGVRAEPQAFVHRGYAVFRPNPRGSAGRGQDYARRVVGDMGGKDTGDILQGVDALVRRGIADPGKLGVMGVSYGGFMSSWLITQDSRFKASIPISPVTNWVSMQWTTNVPHFVRKFLDDRPLVPGGLYHQRSPVSHVDKVVTPALVVGGARDRISPPEQAVEFYRALRQYGVESALVLYPEEGHNVRSMPATVDASARYIDWFDRHLLGQCSAPRDWSGSQHAHQRGLLL